MHFTRRPERDNRNPVIADIAPIVGGQLGQSPKVPFLAMHRFLYMGE